MHRLSRVQDRSLGFKARDDLSGRVLDPVGRIERSKIQVALPGVVKDTLGCDMASHVRSYL